MVIPRFSIAWLMGLTLVCGLVSLVIFRALPKYDVDDLRQRQALQQQNEGAESPPAKRINGDLWAIATTAVLGTAVVVFLSYCLAFLAAWLISQIENAIRSRGQPPSSPFKPGSTPMQSSFAPIAPPVISDMGETSPPPITG